MNDVDYVIRAPGSNQEWLEFHGIRRKVLFENRGKGEAYLKDHPDDSMVGNHPLIILFHNEIIGVVRVDVCEKVALLRRIAIRDDLQNLGHGRNLLRLAERFARSHGCTEVRVNSAVEASGFYERCGYSLSNVKSQKANSVSMFKLLD